MKKIYKYGTGEVVPEGAEYMSTIVDEIEMNRWDEKSKIISGKYV